VKTPTKEKRFIEIPSAVPGAADEFIPEDPTKSNLVPVTLSSTESDLNNVKSFIPQPAKEHGPPVSPTPLYVMDDVNQALPTRIQVTLKMPDESTAVGLIVADSPTGPYTFYPGASNPLPTSLKLQPTYKGIKMDTSAASAPPATPEEAVKTPIAGMLQFM